MFLVNFMLNIDMTNQTKVAADCFSLKVFFILYLTFCGQCLTVGSDKKYRKVIFKLQFIYVANVISNQAARKRNAVL